MQIRSYDLFLDLDFKNLKFDGRVVIDLVSEGDVELNSLDLEITQVKGNGKPVQHHQVGEDLVVKTGPFSGKLEIQYRGAVSNNLVGLYKAPYGDTFVVSTQFEAANARRFLPCFDHPAYKAEFKVTVRADKDLSVISNMPAESVNTEGDKKVVVFQKTPKMSTYLLYLGVGKFEEAGSKLGGLDVRVATTPGKAVKTEFALNVAKESVKFYESYFGSPYVLPKLHLVGVPEFAAGAMENWGAITFREVYLLVDESTSIRTKKIVAEATAHEVAHMWFGNLVTMKWWDDLWLNESFATFMAFKLVDSLFPQWKVWQDFLRADTSSAMVRDSLRSTHPIHVSVSDPSEIEQLFDQISYGKGASILRMLEAFVGSEHFRDGIRSYLHQYKFSNATEEDLWSHLEKSSRSQVKKIMNDWIRKPGYPVLTVSLRGGKLAIRQERFMLSGAHERTVWPVPVSMKINGTIKRMLLEKEEDQVDLPQSLKTLTVNVGQTGFYRVYYDGLYDLVWNSELSAIDKFGMISDAFAFAVSGRVSFREYLDHVAMYHDEDEYLPVYEVSDQLALLYSIVPGAVAGSSSQFHKSQLEILERKSDENSVLLRGVVAHRLALVDRRYAEDLAKRFPNYETVEPDMRHAVAAAYARTTGDFEGLLKKYKDSPSDEEKVRFLAALMSFQKSQTLTQSLELATSGQVKRQDVYTMLLSAAGNPNGRETMWLWLRVNNEWLSKLYKGTGNTSRLLQQIIPYVGIGKVAEVEKFFAQNTLTGTEKGVEAGLERLRIYDAFVQRIGTTPSQAVETIPGEGKD